MEFVRASLSAPARLASAVDVQSRGDTLAVVPDYGIYVRASLGAQPASLDVSTWPVTHNPV